MSVPVLTITNQIDLRSRAERDRGPRSFAAQSGQWSINRAEPATKTGSTGFIVDFDLLRYKVLETAALPKGWDSGNAGPMSADAIQHALWLLDGLEAARISPTRVIPTCDDSILIRYPLHDQTIEWEFFSEGDNIRVQIEPTGEKSYLEIPADQIRQHI
jgi:hypothetical protein